MSRITDEMLIAYADGELGPEDRVAVEAALAENASLRETLTAQQRLRAAISAHYGPIEAEPVPERLRAMLEPEAAIVDLAAAREKREARRRLFGWPHFGAMAASLAAGVMAGQLAFSSEGPVAFEGEAMLARGTLAETLETRLASAPAAGAETRIGLSFEDREGRLCRTFDAAALSGIACREPQGWRLVMTTAGAGAATEYRQAGSPLVLEQAQAMMAAAPLDAAGENAARDRGWRPD